METADRGKPPRDSFWADSASRAESDQSGAGKAGGAWDSNGNFGEGARRTWPWNSLFPSFTVFDVDTDFVTLSEHNIVSISEPCFIHLLVDQKVDLFWYIISLVSPVGNFQILARFYFGPCFVVDVAGRADFELVHQPLFLIDFKFCLNESSDFNGNCFNKVGARFLFFPSSLSFWLVHTVWHRSVCTVCCVEGEKPGARRVEIYQRDILN